VIVKPPPIPLFPPKSAVDLASAPGLAPALETATALAFTGERFHPDCAGEMWFEHWHRYYAVSHLLIGKRVLDIASGEGYGSAHMAGFASNLIGVDIDAAAIAHANATYADIKNLRFIRGSCTRIPLPDASVDVVVSFETLEHIEAHQSFVGEIKRVLVTGGLLIISTPNKAQYSDARGYKNEFHVKELYLNEFQALLDTTFAHKQLLGQRNGFHSLIQPLEGSVNQGLVTIESMAARAGSIPAPLYIIALASDDKALLDGFNLPLSAYTAREDNQVEVYMQIWRHSQHLESRVADLTAQNKIHEDTIIELSNQLSNKLAASLPAASDANNSQKPALTVAVADESSIARWIKKISR
jgi:SAM-dependent methyltransferase